MKRKIRDKRRGRSFGEQVKRTIGEIRLRIGKTKMDEKNRWTGLGEIRMKIKIRNKRRGRMRGTGVRG